MVFQAPTRRSVKGMPAATMCRGIYSLTPDETPSFHLTVTPICATQARNWSQQVVVTLKLAPSLNSSVMRATHVLNINNERCKFNHEMMEICLVHTILSLRWTIIADIRRGVACDASLILLGQRLFQILVYLASYECFLCNFKNVLYVICEINQDFSGISKCVLCVFRMIERVRCNSSEWYIAISISCLTVSL